MEKQSPGEDGYSGPAAHGDPGHLALLTDLGLGAITLDRQGRAIHLNAAVHLGDGLEVIRAQPRASHRGDQPALEAAIDKALADRRTFADAEASRPLRVALRRPSGRRALLVGVVPLEETPTSLAAALMLITDLDRVQAPEVEELRRLFDLTPREAELAALLATGTTLEDAAAQIGISTGHARQRLKIVFAKTQTHRQPALVALLSRLGNGRG